MNRYASSICKGRADLARTTNCAEKPKGWPEKYKELAALAQLRGREATRGALACLRSLQFESASGAADAQSDATGRAMRCTYLTTKKAKQFAAIYASFGQMQKTRRFFTLWKVVTDLQCATRTQNDARKIGLSTDGVDQSKASQKPWRSEAPESNSA